jgi:hypothetical protein
VDLDNPSTALKIGLPLAVSLLAALFAAGIASRRGHPFVRIWLSAFLLGALVTPAIAGFAIFLRRAKRSGHMMLSCEACQSPLSAAAYACPACGHPTGARFRVVRDVAAILVGIPAVLVGFLWLAVRSGLIDLAIFN